MVRVDKIPHVTHKKICECDRFQQLWWHKIWVFWLNFAPQYWISHVCLSTYLGLLDFNFMKWYTHKYFTFRDEIPEKWENNFSKDYFIILSTLQVYTLQPTKLVSNPLKSTEVLVTTCKGNLKILTFVLIFWESFLSYVLCRK